MTDMPVPLKIDIDIAVRTLIEAARANGDYEMADADTLADEDEALAALDVLLCAVFRDGIQK